MMGAMLMAGCSQSNKEQDGFDYTVEQFADLQLLRFKVHGFEELPLEQKKLVYYLSEAALQGREGARRGSSVLYALCPARD